MHNGNYYSSFSKLVNNLNTFTTNCVGDSFGLGGGGGGVAGREGHFVSFNTQTNE